MSKTKKSIYNLVASIIAIVVQQIITLVVSRKVLSIYGSEINGVNAVFTNTLVWLLLIEGGFTFASSVALFKAFAVNDLVQVNRILSATKKVLNKIGLFVAIGGVLLAVIAPVFIKSSISYRMLLYMFLLMAFGTYFGLSFTRKYALMFSVKQELYIKTIISIIVSIISNSIIYYIVSPSISYIWVRVVFAFSVVLTGLISFFVVKRRYAGISYDTTPDMAAIKGTKDMIFNKFAFLVKSSIPLIYIASVVGAAYSSVYSVYMIIFGFISKLSMMLTNAVQNSFGQLIAENSPEEVFKRFKIFEFLVILLTFFLISVSMPITLPFIRFYTRNVHDVNYISLSYLILFSLITLIQVIHIPSGVIMLMSGEFKQSKKIQINSLIVLLIGIIFGGLYAKVNGILFGILLSGIILAIQEIIFTRRKYFKKGFKDFFKTIGIIGTLSFFLIVLEFNFVPENISFISILYYAMGLGLINLLVMLVVVVLVFYDIFKELLLLWRKISLFNN